METSPADVAEIVTRRTDARFVPDLKDAYRACTEPQFEAALAVALRSRPELVDAWQVWSADQRWTPSAYVDGIETGWYDTGRRNVVHHHDEPDAVADFIHRLSAWLSEERITGGNPDVE